MFAYSPIIGLVAAIFMTLASTLITGRAGVGVMLKSGAYIVVSVLAFITAPLGIVAGGMILVVIYNLLLRGTLLLLGSNKEVGITTMGVNIALNYLLLAGFGEILLNLL